MGTLTDTQEQELYSAPTPRRLWIWAALPPLLIAASAIALSLARKSADDQSHQVSLTNLRRLGIGINLYAQDWDGRPMPLKTKASDGTVYGWDHFVGAYIESENLINPLNPLAPDARHAREGYPIKTSYAFNRRFWNTFGRGSFPLDGLELPAQTALCVEAGAAWRDPLRVGSERRNVGLTEYTDVSDRIDGFSPFPSAHEEGRLAIVAADGHLALVKVSAYAPSAPHDRLLGRIGGNIYNWNGGCALGKTDAPPKE